MSAEDGQTILGTEAELNRKLALSTLPAIAGLLGVPTLAIVRALDAMAALPIREGEYKTLAQVLPTLFLNILTEGVTHLDEAMLVVLLGAALTLTTLAITMVRDRKFVQARLKKMDNLTKPS